MKTTNTKSNSRGSVMVTGLFVVVFLLAVTGYFLYKHQQHAQAVAKERAEYAQAEKDLDALSAQIIAKFGQPEDQKKVRSCGYQSAFSEMGKGPLHCEVDNQIEYSVASFQIANSYVNNFKAELESKGIIKYGEEKDIIVLSNLPLEVARVDYRFKALNCFIDYTVDSSATPSQRKLTIESSCSVDKPQAPYYQIQNS